MPTEASLAKRVDLGAREELFASTYVRTLNGTEAVRQAGYTSKNPRRMAHELLKRPRVQALIAAKQTRQLAQFDLSAVRVKRELARIAFLDPKDCFAEDGTPLHVHEMSPDIRAAIRSVRVVCRDGKPVVSSVEFWPKTDALKLAAQHLALLAPHEVTVTHRFPHAHLTDAELKQRLLESANAIDAEPVVDVAPEPAPEPEP